MHEILPIGSKILRRGKDVRLVFGDAIDCDERYLQDVARQGEGAELSGLALWETLAARTYDALRQVELLVHPSPANESDGLVIPQGRARESAQPTVGT
jgi:hypothetical protein